MANAKRVSSHVPGWAEKLSKAQLKAASREGTFKGKTFEELSPQEKEDLLKAVAIQLQLIEAS